MLDPFDSFDMKAAERIEGIFFDIDDTFTFHGKIPAPAFEGLWRLKERGLKVVPITGRPAGWCDHIARMWPVDAVVGENGAFYFTMREGKLKKRFLDSEDVRRSKRAKLKAVEAEILASVCGTALASDQPYREADVAIDFCEDVPRLGWDDIERICAIFRKYGANCKVSSIHVNGWFGDYDKLNMTKIMARELWDVDLEREKSRFLFCGDSPNDEPMFRFFPKSVGVRNILPFTEKMRDLPAYVTEKEGGWGFAELARRIVGWKPGRRTG
ncbi:MAG: HAD-IIB family hydrolase [Desulfobacteraceae bacterium]|nr:HAD-IIB family hydrolase [Desulfobacteraceae bacterium]